MHEFEFIRAFVATFIFAMILYPLNELNLKHDVLI